MRLNKIMALGLMSAMALVSCQQTVTPTGDAAVGFASAEFESGLGSEYIYVPIVTTGETTVFLSRSISKSANTPAIMPPRRMSTS